MTADTTDASYWLNWRFFVCAIFVLASMLVAAFLIWKFEGSKKSKTEGRHNSQDTVGTLYKDEAWRTSLKAIRPAWLLAYRLTVFCVLLLLLIVNVVLDGGDVFYYYTQWTFSLVIIYFGFASVFSICGCCQCGNEVGGDGADRVALVAERGTCMSQTLEENSYKQNTSKSLDSHEKFLVRQTASVWGYIFQIIYQICAGSVVLTDLVFWFIIYPFLTSADYTVGFIDAAFHSINAVFLLGDLFLNCLRFPFFRIAYFILWTCIYVIFQWIVHACVSMWWPYPFLELSSSYAPIWYIAVGLLHLPCYGIFSLINTLKHFWLRKFFPNALQI